MPLSHFAAAALVIDVVRKRRRRQDAVCVRSLVVDGRNVLDLGVGVPAEHFPTSPLTRFPSSYLVRAGVRVTVSLVSGEKRRWWRFWRWFAKHTVRAALIGFGELPRCDEERGSNGQPE